MADYKNKDGSGVLFFNDDKKHEKAPDYKGKLILDRDTRKAQK